MSRALYAVAAVGGAALWTLVGWMIFVAGRMAWTQEIVFPALWLPVSLIVLIVAMGLSYKFLEEQ